MNESLGISVTNMCYQCYALNELCPDCLEAKEIRDIQNAHQIVDEHSDYYFRGYGANKTAVASAGSLGEPSPLSSLRDETSGHDWVGSVIKLSNRTKRYKIGASMTDTTIREYLVIEEIDGDHRDEFLEPIANLTDRFMDLETSLTITHGETICTSCHLVCNKHAVCPNCN